jgi:LPS-assembly protein
MIKKLYGIAMLCSCATAAYAADEAAPKQLESPFSPGAKPIFSEKEPVLLEASEVHYFQKEAMVVASGKVAVTQGDTVVLADTLSYDQNKNIVVAKGNVSMLEPSGNVYFADTLELKDDLQAGVIHAFRARLSDNSLLAAAGARKIDENRLELYKAAYSPCNVLCDDGTPKSPQWQVKADRVLVDQVEQTVTYDDARLEVYGLPVLYSPYFSHPTPDADNQSGLLAPEYRHSDNLGSVIKVPVYFALAPDKDITLTPILTGTEGLVMAGEYRQALDSGKFEFDGSITQPKDRDALGSRSTGKQIRGHLNGKGKFSINENYDWGFDIHRTTDDTYLRRYNFSNDTLLTSKIYAEGFRFPGTNDRSYATIRGLAFQGLTAQDDQDRIPLVTPLVDFTFESDPGRYNSRFFLNGGAMVLTRDTGAVAPYVVHGRAASALYHRRRADHRV